EVAQVAEAGINIQEIGHIVAVIAPRRGVKGVQPEAGDPQSGQVAQPLRQPQKIADSIPVPVLERFDVDRVHDRVLVPEVSDRHAVLRVGSPDRRQTTDDSEQLSSVVCRLSSCFYFSSIAPRMTWSAPPASFSRSPLAAS